jgi:signal peptidase I
MANKWRKYSYSAQKNYLRKIRILLLWIFVFFVLYILLTSFVFSSRTVETGAMEPSCKAGDRFIFSSFTIHHLFREKTQAGLPFQRGQIVLVDRSAGKQRNIINLVFDAALRFCTLQKMSLFPREDTIFLKRVIALPGDTVTIRSYAARIKPAGERYEYTESELALRDYIPGIPQVSVLWDESLPFSASMKTVILKDNECFVLSDDRSNTNDSRTWGPVPVSSITGRALVRYWPFTRIGFQ